MATELLGHKDAVLCLQSGWEHFLLSGSEDTTARLWDLRSAKAVRCFKAFGSDAVTSVCFLEENFVAVAAGSKAYEFDLRKDGVVLSKPECAIAYNKDEINQLAFQSAGNLLAACDDAGDVKLVERKAHSLYKSLHGKHSNLCSSVVFRPNSASDVATGGMDNTVLLWNATTGRYVHKFDSNPPAGDSGRSGQLVNPAFVHNLAASGDGAHLVAALGNSQIVIFDWQRRRELARLHGHHAAVTQVQFAAFDPSVLVSAGNDRCLVLWRVPLFEAGSDSADATGAEPERKTESKATASSKKRRRGKKGKGAGAGASAVDAASDSALSDEAAESASAGSESVEDKKESSSSKGDAKDAAGAGAGTGAGAESKAVGEASKSSASAGAAGAGAGAGAGAAASVPFGRVFKHKTYPFSAGDAELLDTKLISQRILHPEKPNWIATTKAGLLCVCDQSPVIACYTVV